ncbi:MAG TPA: YhbY family RNA-binding protein [Casimicrobiaceae bacterium]
MPTLTPAERRALRARAHALRPVVSVGQHGLTPSVLHEIDVSLKAHELIKVRMASDDRAAREAALERICTELDATPVQHIGKLLVIFRRLPPSLPEPARPKSAAKKAPQVRRPRTPLPRTSPRPMPSGPRSRTPASSPAGPKHRGGITMSGRRRESPEGDAMARSPRAKPPRTVTAAMWDDGARTRRRPRGDGRAPPGPSFGTRRSGGAQGSAKPRPAGGPQTKRRVRGAPPEGRGPAPNARRRRTPR